MKILKERKDEEKYKLRCQRRNKNNRCKTNAWHTEHSDTKLSYLWIAEPEIQTSKVSEKAEASKENPVLNSRNRKETVKKWNKKQSQMERRERAKSCASWKVEHDTAQVSFLCPAPLWSNTCVHLCPCGYADLKIRSGQAHCWHTSMFRQEKATVTIVDQQKPG